MYRLNVQATQQEHQQQQQQQLSSSSHIILPKKKIEQQQTTTSIIKNNNILLQKSINEFERKATIIPTTLNVLENIFHGTTPTPVTTITLKTATTTNSGVDTSAIDAAAADLTLPHLIRICGTKTVVATPPPTIINTDPLRLPIGDESMTSDINNESLSEQQQNAFLRHVNETVVGDKTTFAMAANLEDKLKYLAALKTEPILNEVMTTTTTTTPSPAVITTTTTTHFKKRHSKNEASGVGIAIVGGGVNSLQNTKYLENMAADLTISKGSTTSSKDTGNSSTITKTVLSGEPTNNTINLSLEPKSLYASNVVVVSGDSLDGISNSACLLVYEATKRPRLDSPKHWLPTSSPGGGATSSSVPPSVLRPFRRIKA